MSPPFGPMHPLEIVPERQLAERWGKSLRFMQRLRRHQLGPPWLRIGASVYYRMADVYAFERANLRTGKAR